MAIPMSSPCSSRSLGTSETPGPCRPVVSEGLSRYADSSLPAFQKLEARPQAQAVQGTTLTLASHAHRANDAGSASRATPNQLNLLVTR